MRKADVKAQNPEFEEERLRKVSKIMLILEEIIAEEQCFSLKDLEVNGNDVLDAGISAGKQVGFALNLLLEYVINDECENTKDALLSKLCEIRGQIDEFGQSN